MNTRRALLTLLAIALITTLPACASKDPGKPMRVDATGDEAPVDDHDPLESINRGIFQFNRVFDGMLLEPVAHIYRGVVPDMAQKSVKNALANLAAPVVFLNSVLQADVNNASRTLGRFVINSTVGIAGLFDVASYAGIKKEHDKDFGQTLGVYGIAQGPYLMLPILGPSDLRDFAGMGVDVVDDPWTWVFTTGESVARDVTRTIVKRADLIPLTDQVYRDSLDPYASFRSIYQQHRTKVVRDYLNRDAGALEKEKETGK